MRAPQGDPVPPPHPEMLAAYADGEFEGNDCLQAQRRAVEAWLDQHPEAHADIAAWRRLKNLWRETPPPGPAEAAWNKVLAGIRQGVEQAEKEAARKRRIPWWGWVLGGAAAALVLFLLSGIGEEKFQPAPVPFKKQEAPSKRAVEVLPVATAAEVEILRVAGEDTSTLVVGAPPRGGRVGPGRQGGGLCGARGTGPG